MVPSADWSGANWGEHAERSNREVIFIPLIETVRGIENFEAIAAVDGVEFAFFGLGDLAQDMGTDMYAGRERLIEMWEVASASATRAGLRLGAPGGIGFDGTSFTTIGGDLNFVRAAGADKLAQFRSGAAQ